MKQQKTLTRRPPQQSLTKKPSSGSIKTTSFADHIGELRGRALIVALVFIIAASIAYSYHDLLVKWIMQPLGSEKLIYLTPAGGFNFVFQIAIYAGLLIAAPVLMYQLYGFIRPALPERAKRSAFLVVTAAFFLMILGASFGYFMAVPSALHFLSGFAGTDIVPNLTADSYLSFMLVHIAGLGVLFELPLLLLFFHWIHPLTPKKLLKSERWVVLLGFIVAAAVSPSPDVINQTLIAVPLILIYQLGIIAVLISIRKEHRRVTDTQRTQVMQVGPTLPVRSVQPPRVLSSDPQHHITTIPKTAIDSTQPIEKLRPLQGDVKKTVSNRSLDGFTVRQKQQTTTPVRTALPLRTPKRRDSGVRQPYRRPFTVDGFPAA